MSTIVRARPEDAVLVLLQPWILNDLFVAAEARGCGIGATLLERTRQSAVETGTKSLVLATAVDDLPAQHLYESLG